MVNIYIEYQEHGKFNAKALMFFMDLSGIKYEWKVVPSFGYGNLKVDSKTQYKQAT